MTESDTIGRHVRVVMANKHSSLPLEDCIVTLGALEHDVTTYGNLYISLNLISLLILLKKIIDIEWPAHDHE